MPISPADAAVALQVIFIDLVLSGDNALVVGMAAAGVPRECRRKAIIYGVLGALVFRVALAVVATQILDLVGLLFAGGILLLWVCWRLQRELRHAAHESCIAPALAQAGGPGRGGGATGKSYAIAMRQIIVADISMSLDNVLAVAGAAQNHPTIMAAGLVLSVALMALGAHFVARVMERCRWLGWIGLALILYVALQMMWQGAWQIQAAMA